MTLAESGTTVLTIDADSHQPFVVKQLNNTQVSTYSTLQAAVHHFTMRTGTHPTISTNPLVFGRAGWKVFVDPYSLQPFDVLTPNGILSKSKSTLTEAISYIDQRLTGTYTQGFWW